MSERDDADRRSHAETRNLLSNERTFLAWLRTAVALMTFGFVLAKFDLFLQTRFLHGAPPRSTPRPVGAHNTIGLALVLVGVLTLSAATMHFHRVRTDILHDSGHSTAYSRLPFLLAGLLVATGIALAIYLWKGPGL